jgi:predicted phosphoribosyltransferase
MFEDRKDAGKKLAKALEKYKNKGVLVLAIPRGGVEVGYQIAKYLNADFSILISIFLDFYYLRSL